MDIGDEGVDVHHDDLGMAENESVSFLSWKRSGGRTLASVWEEKTYGVNDRGVRAGAGLGILIALVDLRSAIGKGGERGHNAGGEEGEGTEDDA